MGELGGKTIIPAVNIHLLLMCAGRKSAAKPVRSIE